MKTVTVADKTATGKLTVNTVKTKTTKVTGKQKPNPTPLFALNQLEKSSALPKHE
ncbi:hypothetical protein SB775_13750 [Peribacillus sp. SIMBA_075]|uniref:hypothetical protein n=1 Tax=Peribacillus sp. SIMBA_075 TaxID=3085813 RepID=UPI00397BC055